MFLTLRLRDLHLPLSTSFLSILSHRAKNNLHGAGVWAAHSSPCPRPCPVPVGRVGEGAGSLAGGLRAGCGVSAGEVARWHLEAVWMAVFGIPPRTAPLGSGQ